MGRPLTEIVAPACRDRASIRPEQVPQGQSLAMGEMQWLASNGSTLDVEVSVAAVGGANGMQIHVFARDIGERKRAHRNMLRLANLYSALSRTSQSVARLHTREELLPEVCRISVEFGRMQMTCAAWIDERLQRLHPLATSGPGKHCRHMQIGLDSAEPDADAEVAAALSAHHAYICNDLAAVSRNAPWRQAAYDLGFRAVAVVPLREQDRPVGALLHFALESDFFDSALTDLLSRMADEIAPALDRFAAERSRVAMGQALLDKQRQMETLLGNLPGMVYRCRDDADYTMEFVSEGSVELTGYRPEELLGSCTVGFEAITHPHDRQRVREQLDRNLREHLRYTLEYRIRDRHGNDKWVLDKGLWVLGQDGRVEALEGFVSDITEIKTYREQLEHQATHDTLTGLANRTLLHDRLRQAMVQSQRQRSLLAVLFIDLDQFKFINDTVGHTVGDELLKHAAERLRACVREGDTVARLGGDEFVLVLSDQAGVPDVSHAVERVLVAMSQPYRILGKEFGTTCSLGVSLYPQDGAEADTLLKHADAAMYRAKAQGRNGFCFFTAEINAQLSERLALEHDLRRALRSDEFVLHYQPKVALESGALIGAEALVRWRHPELGMLSPARFIPVAEETGLIVPLGEWIMREACTQARIWRERGMQFNLLSVNLSPRQFKQRELEQQIAKVLADSGLPAECLDLELTESLMMENAEEYILRLEKLKSLGVQLSVDDFGTGYSSLNYLKQFPVDRLKIDQSFVRDITGDAGDAAIVQAIIQLGQILGLSVTAEGVEDEAQLAFLRRHGCDEAQGYYFSPPLTADAFEALWKRGLLASAGSSTHPCMPAAV
jgi:diguanylate cyclase (GGDEF)-like protein/PAS domain S-box-containing protein